jgi:hypothetical protein
MSSPLPSSGSGFTWRDVLPYFGAIAASVLTWFAAQFSQVARLEKTLLDASRQLVEAAQTQRAQDSARISELEGRLRQLQQWRASAERWAKREGHSLPQYRTDP